MKNQHLKYSSCGLLLALFLTAQSALGGAIWHGLYYGISGDSVSNLVNAPAFNRSGSGAWPELLDKGLDSAQGDPVGWPDRDTHASALDFGTITRGYLEAPQTGAYRLFLACDDNAELYLGTNHTIFAFRNAGSLVVAVTNGGTGGNVFSGPSGQVTLQKGQKYFMELLHKQDAAEASFLRVGWQLPDGTREIIPARCLAPYGTSSDLTTEATSTEVTADPSSQSQSVEEGATASFHATVFAKQPTTLQWLRNGNAIPGENLSWLRWKATMADNGATFSLRIVDGNNITNTTGAAFLSVTPDTTPPRLLNARGSGNPHGILVTFSEAVDPGTATNTANYQITGQSLTLSAASLHRENEVLLSVSTYDTNVMTVTVNNVKDASSTGNVIAPGSQAAVALKTALAAYWDFNGGSGGLAADLGSEGHVGTLVGASTWTVDTPALGARANPYALQFDGSTAYVGTEWQGIAGGNPRTVSCWVKTGVSNVNNGFIGWGNVTGNGKRFALRVNHSSATNNPVQGALETMLGNECRIRGTKVLADAAWHHVAVVVPAMAVPRASNVVDYVDGSADAVASAEGDFAVDTQVDAANSQPVTIGKIKVGVNMVSYHFNGLMDDVAIFDQALSAAQVAQLTAGADPRSLLPALSTTFALTGSPTNRTVNELQSTTFYVQTTGNPATLRYQWLRNGVAIPGATSSSYTLNPVMPADNAAIFRADVFNVDGAYGRLSSANATLTVNVDTTPPAIVSVRGLDAVQDKVVVTFSEPVDVLSATTLTNYSITNLSGAGLNLSAVSLDTAGTRVTLITGPQTAGTTYSLTVKGVKDRSVAGNALTTNVLFVSELASASVTVYWNRHPTDVTSAYGASNLVYSLDVDGFVTGGGAYDVLEGAAPVAGFANLLTVSAWDQTNYPGVVVDGSTNDVLEARRVGAGWDTSGLTQLGFGVQNNTGIAPGDRMWNYTNEFMILTFQSPPGNHFMTVGTTVANQNIAVFEAGHANNADGTAGSSFSKTLAPGQTLNVLLANKTYGGARRLATATMTFFVPQPTLSIALTNGQARVSWSPVVGRLRAAPAVTGPWSDLATVSPYVVPATNAARFFRVDVP